jgi:hypothetical protein
MDPAGARSTPKDDAPSEVSRPKPKLVAMMVLRSLYVNNQIDFMK